MEQKKQTIENLEGNTLVQVSMDTWRRLIARKQSPSDTFENVIRRLLE